MVINPEQLGSFERSLQRRDDLSLEKKFQLLDGMYRLARGMGHFTPERSLEGIDHVIALATALHSLVRTDPR